MPGKRGKGREGHSPPRRAGRRPPWPPQRPQSASWRILGKRRGQDRRFAAEIEVRLLELEIEIGGLP